MKKNYETKNWIENIIESSLTWNQLTTCERLVNNFKKKMEDDNFDKKLLDVLIYHLNSKIKKERKKIIENKLIIKN